MRDTVQLERSGYQATGKHWFALKLIIGLGILGLLSMLPVKDNVMHWGYVVIASHGIFEALRLLLTPHSSHEAADDGQSPLVPFAFKEHCCWLLGQRFYSSPFKNCSDPEYPDVASRSPQDLQALRISLGL